MTDPTTHTLDIPGATLTYDIREAESGEPIGGFHEQGDPDAFTATLRRVLAEAASD